MDPSEITRCLSRVQNQRQPTAFNILVDAAGLIVGLLTVFI